MSNTNTNLTTEQLLEILDARDAKKEQSKFSYRLKTWFIANWSGIIVGAIICYVVLSFLAGSAK